MRKGWRHLLSTAPRIGLAVDSTHVRAVAMRGSRMLWAAESDVAARDSLSATAEALLSRGSLPRWPRPRVTASIGPARVQVRRLVGLPPLKASHALEALVRENVARFFLRNGVPLVTSGILRAEDGATWAAAFELPVVEAIEAACRARGMRFEAAVPGSVSLRTFVRDATVYRRDGDVAEEFTLERGALVRVARRRAECSPSSHDGVGPRIEGESITVPEELTVLGESAGRFIEAFCAARSDPVPPLSLRPGAQRGSHPPVPRWRAVLAGLTLLAAGIAALLAEPLHSTLIAARARETLARLGEARVEAARAEQELERVSGALDEAGAFERRSRQVISLLGLFADSLPAGTALVTLRLDSAGGSAVILSAQLATAMTILDRQTAVVSPEIRGPVTRERIAGRDVERATLHFRLRVGSRGAQAPLRGGAP